MADDKKHTYDESKVKTLPASSQFQSGRIQLGFAEGRQGYPV